MLLVPTIAAASAIQGVGLFAAAPIARGTVIWRFEPVFDRIIPDAEVAALPEVARAFIERYGYITPQIPGGWVVSLDNRSEEHTSELQSLMRISYAVFCLKNKISNKQVYITYTLRQTMDAIGQPRLEFALGQYELLQ